MQSVTLIIDKRRELSTKYKKLLAGKHNKCLISKNLISAMKTIQELEPDLIIISDSNEGQLADYCKQIRALTYNMRPIIVATSKSAEFNDKIKVLENDLLLWEKTRYQIGKRHVLKQGLNVHNLVEDNYKFSISLLFFLSKRIVSSKNHSDK